MKKKRFWIEVLTLCAGAAFGLALALAFVGAVVMAFGETAEPPQSAAQPDHQQTYVGMVTCSRCFAKHSAKIGATATDCARVCIRDGANFTFVNGDRIYLLEGDPAALKRVAGQRVQIVGALNGRTITGRIGRRRDIARRSSSACPLTTDGSYRKFLTSISRA